MYRKAKKKSNLLYSQLILTIVGLVIFTSILFPLFKNINKQYKVNQEIKELEKEITSLEKNNQDLLKLIDFLESDQFVTEQARLKLNYKKQGEEVVVIKDKDQLIEERMKIFEVKEKEENLSNPQRWLRYFIKSKG